MNNISHYLSFRHGESIWNVTDHTRGLTARFTGWEDIPLTELGRRQARAAGKCLELFGIKPSFVYTSLLQRSKDSFREICEVHSTFPKDHCFVVSSWRMNERHYGSLVGMSKDSAGDELGHDLVTEWRRSWDVAPPKMSPAKLQELIHSPSAQPITVIQKGEKRMYVIKERGLSIPETESLKDCAERVLPLWEKAIAPRVAMGDTILVVTHANSIRAMLKHIEGDQISSETIKKVHIPSAFPLVYEFVLDSSNSHEKDPTVHKHLCPSGLPSSLGIRGRYLGSPDLFRLNLGWHAEEDYDSFHDRILKNEVDENSVLGCSLSTDIWKSCRFLSQYNRCLLDILSYCDNEGQQDALVVTNSSGQIIYANQSWRELTQFSQEEIVGKTCRILQGASTNSNDVARWREKLWTGQPVRASAINYKKNGDPFVGNFAAIPIFEDTKNIQDLFDENSNIIFGGASECLQTIRPAYFLGKLTVESPNVDLPPLSYEDQYRRYQHLQSTIQNPKRFWY